MLETIPTISLDPSAKYVGMASVYARLLDNGPLTDAKIRKYRALGYFSNGISDPRLRLKAEVKVKRAKRKTLEQLIQQYD